MSLEAALRPGGWLGGGTTGTGFGKLSITSPADLFVIPSLKEGLPNTVMAAMACGTLVAGFAAAGTADMVRHGVTGRSGWRRGGRGRPWPSLLRDYRKILPGAKRWPRAVGPSALKNILWRSWVPIMRSYINGSCWRVFGPQTFSPLGRVIWRP